MVHELTKEGPLVNRVPLLVDLPCEKLKGFPIEESGFKCKEGGKGIQGGKHDNFEIGNQPTAEYFWQAKLAKRDYHAYMTDVMFMDWLRHRLTPAFVDQFVADMKMIVVLDNASYNHGFDPEVRVPETNSKKYSPGILRKNGATTMTVKRRVTNADGGEVARDFNVKVPLEGTAFPRRGQILPEARL